MMQQKINAEALAAVVTKAVLEALNSLETPKVEPRAVAKRGATIKPKQFSAETGVGINQVYELCRTGRIKNVKLGERNLLIPESEIQNFLEREAVGGKR